MIFKQKLTLVAAALATIASGLAVTTMVGREVRLVELIAIFAGGFGAGASLTAAIMASRSSRTGPLVGEAAEGPAPSGEA